MSAATAATVAVSGSGGRSNKFPFTTTQWQELEHQALIYKYMAAGIPIPPDLLFSIKRSLDSSLSTKLFPYQSTPLGWNPYQMGYGKKIDPEPGRCRRTDGKKWRCSKEAYPDSKYCERHMHRGKNRSRKPVESTTNPSLTNNTNINTNTNNSINNSNSNSNNSNSNMMSTTGSTTSNISPINPTNTVSSNNFTQHHHHHHSSLPTHNNNNNNNNNKPSSNSSLYSFPSSDSFYNSFNANLLYPHAPSSYTNKDYRDRYYQGLKEEVGEHAFFTTESSGSSMRGFSGSSMDESWPNFSNNQYNNNNNGSAARQQEEQQQQDKQCYIWGRDFNCELSMKVDEEERSNLSEKTTHHFFDEWPIKTGGGLRDDSSSTTQLSISIPSSASHHHDFFLSNSRNP